MDLFRLDPGLALWTWITFALLFFIVAKWVLPPLLRRLDEREHLIAKAVDDAIALEERLKAIDREKEDVLARARAEGEALLRQVRQEAASLRQSLLEQALRDVETLSAQGRVRVDEERQVALAALRDELADFALACAGAIVGTALVGDKERSWVREQARLL